MTVRGWEQKKRPREKARMKVPGPKKAESFEGNEVEESSRGSEMLRLIYAGS